MACRTKVFVLVVFCLLVVSILFAATTTANDVATERKEETNYVADVNTGVEKDLKEHTIGLIGEVAKDLDMKTLEDEKHKRRYGRGHYGIYNDGNNGAHNGNHHCYYPHC
ncbi:hypothetical protein ZOSMA_262G00010 [Zostera marina]|uniref:Glycine-rich protein n=1 Tax=Zostera marina TaxID=29655 RepID=A0A0K9PF21_ZOSMR|nr:hypothetical protein ZOSMA_262G00010 [Zostera marina]